MRHSTSYSDTSGNNRTWYIGQTLGRMNPKMKSQIFAYFYEYGETINGWRFKVMYILQPPHRQLWITFFMAHSTPNG